MKLIAFILLVQSFQINHVKSDCVITSDSIRQPVLLNKDSGKFYFAIPKNDGVHLQQGQMLYLLCAGHLNKLNYTNSNLSEAVCVVGDRFLVSEQIHKFADLECRRSVRGNVINTGNTCANGLISQIGYYVGDEFLKLIEVCYDGDLGSTIYTRHTINTYSLSEIGFDLPVHKPTFNTKGLSQDNKSVSLVYYTAAQRAKLDSTLQSSILANNYITNSSYLIRGQLTPVADYMLVAWQYSTYFFLNACPQWMSINTGNWKTVEYLVRKLGSTLDENLHVITGTHDVLELPDRFNQLKPIYLSQKGKKYPVPKFIWKVVYTDRSKKAIVLVVYNNPYATNKRYLCSSICDSHGWHSDRWTNAKKGLVHCCNYHQFKQFVRNVPLIQVTGILDGPN